MEDSGKSINNIAGKSSSKLLNPWMLHFQKLALELKCPLCLSFFKQPVLLPCNHLFCSSCMAESATIGSECALCNTKYAQIDLRHVPFVDNMVTIYKNLDATFCANTFQQRSSDDRMVLERCQTLQNSACSNKNTDKVLLNSCMSSEFGAADLIVRNSNSITCSQKEIGDRVEMDLNQVTESAPDSPPFCDTKGSDNCCSCQDSEQPLNVMKSEYSSLKSATTGKSELKEKMAQFRSESSASENEGLRRDMKKQKNLPNGDAIIQQSTSYHNKPVDSRCDLDLRSEKDPGVIISSNTPNDLCPSTSMCSFCQSFNISEATGPMLHYEEGILVTGDAAMQPNVMHVHKVCIDWAPQVYFVGETVKNLKKEVARGAKLKCTQCSLKGAALGCFVKSCKRTYHVPCAMNISTCRWDHVDYLLLCPSHSDVKFPSEDSSRKKKSTQKHPVSSQLPFQQPNNLLGGLKNDGKKMVFCGSALSNEEKVLLINFASKVGATVTKCWTSNVTHVIAAMDANGACSRTIKVLKAILNGQWILKVDWIRACMEETYLVDEECYEVDLDNHGCRGGPKAGRLMALAKEPKIFSGLKFYFSGDYDLSFKKYLEDLVEVGEGAVLKSKDQLEVRIDANVLVVYNIDPPQGCKLGEEVSILWQRLSEAEDLAANTGYQVIGHTWILESIAACKLQPFVS
ncbi:BRCA1-associated RING domain protein 1 isoform X2 [Vicia villosa]|uniref:BRCA1-associated RING domain protein 1 isoform X2 n=1 Tax=Vicia villosa TaxID=3911 RepID=UPI00273A8D2E|nr:BRCA1-associated RING domain protein 1 isoform X2 [Vicia villosa]